MPISQNRADDAKSKFDKAASMTKKSMNATESTVFDAMNSAINAYTASTTVLMFGLSEQIDELMGEIKQLKTELRRVSANPAYITTLR